MNSSFFANISLNNAHIVKLSSNINIKSIYLSIEYIKHDIATIIKNNKKYQGDRRDERTPLNNLSVQKQKIHIKLTGEKNKPDEEMEATRDHTSISTRDQMAHKNYIESEFERICDEQGANLMAPYRYGTRQMEGLSGLKKLNALTGPTNRDQDMHRYILELEWTATQDYHYFRVHTFVAHFFNYDHEYMRSEIDVLTEEGEDNFTATSWDFRHGSMCAIERFSYQTHRFRERYVRRQIAARKAAYEAEMAEVAHV